MVTFFPDRFILPNMKSIPYFVLLAALVSACGPKDAASDAWGAFESREIIVSAQGSGPLLQFTVEEGQELKAGQVIGLIDTLPLQLKKNQLWAAVRALGARTQDISVQRATFEEQLRNLDREVLRVTDLVAAGAATSKQLDDLKGQRDVVASQMKAQVTALGTSNAAVRSEVAPLLSQVEQVEDQIRRCVITTPAAGTVLTTYAEPGEMAAMGKPLFKLADLREMILRAYVTGDQLDQIKLGQTVDVLVESDTPDKPSYQGKISWIASEAEFTPKTIQTRKERASLVYAMKVQVMNDGKIRIGMPAEVIWEKAAASVAGK